VDLATLSLFTCPKQNWLFGGLAFSSQSEFFEIALIGWKKTKLPTKPLLFKTFQMYTARASAKKFPG